MLRIDDLTPISFEKRSIEISLERPRKYPAGLPIRLGVMCRDCSRRCTINLSLPDPFPCVFVEECESVFSSLCVKLDEAPEIAQPDGLQNLSSDASEV